MAEYISVDFSNLCLAGRICSAASKGSKTATSSQTFDQGFNIDVRKLHALLVGASKDQIARAVLFGFRRVDADDGHFLRVARNAGFELNFQIRNASNQEKKVDTSLVAELMIDALQTARKGIDHFTLVARDSDYVPMVKKLTKMQIRIDVVFWDSVSEELRTCASNFNSLDTHLELLSRRQSERLIDIQNGSVVSRTN